MKTITLTRFVATIGAISQVVNGDTTTTCVLSNAVLWDQQPLNISSTINLTPQVSSITTLPTCNEVELVSKWTPSELSTSTDFYLHSPLSPRNKKTKYTYEEEPPVANFTCIDN
ncbi:hypothetical protein THRCLA_22684 [Thraustotheca clavata]|uniref:Secreted protein n=1 Tax=Thraustotheca clavata TaxID=74557 RepID=A0A1V9YUS5_9STRA|nr:hypothetical protein THRCLA_22684 [Thraustotheca clavata]